ncbi:ABC transporter permease [Thermococcus thermotolerans]|uniref:ABC transporter permease n=1 Tax=Thermococcus thermotolerans TaxID=2969672 RepID=UPI00215779A0|nr:ABC transporter permease [Thermococcus thermotolerans]
MKEVLRWELRSPLNLALASAGAVLVGIVMKRYYLTWSAGSHGGPYGVEMLGSVFRDAFTGNVYLLLALLVPFLVTLAVRLERDEGVALSVYSLPVSRVKILLAKFLAAFLALFLFVFSVYLLVFGMHFSTTPDAVLSALKTHIIPMAFFYLSALLFMTSVAALIAIASPNTYVSIFGGFIALYLPVFLGTTWYGPVPWRNALIDYKSATISVWSDPVFSWAFVKMTLLPALVLVALYLFIGNWRDVR